MQQNYIQVTIRNISEELSEILVAQLAELGFEGFEENKNELKAFATSDVFSDEGLSDVLRPLHLEYAVETIAARNWNEEWEKNFDAVIVDDFVAIRADFHAPIGNVAHEMIITPKMSFGTGHHATTYLMMQAMRKLDFKNRSVFDFGTGTGILAILAEKLGAGIIEAIDNDEWSISNAKENAERNNCRQVNCRFADRPAGTERFDIILANINKNVILAYLSELVGRLKENGKLLLSGLLKEDEGDILQAAKRLPTRHISTSYKDKWICMLFSN